MKQINLENLKKTFFNNHNSFDQTKTKCLYPTTNMFSYSLVSGS